MKKEIMVCDICDRERRADEYYIQRPTANNPSGMEDICLTCCRIYPTTVATDEYRPLFWKAANREFWNIL